MIDPRDVTWELQNPAYRVSFWAVPDRASYEWRITDATDVYEVIAWAEAERGERTYELFIEHVDRASGSGERMKELGLIRLAGDDPTAARRGDSVSISGG